MKLGDFSTIVQLGVGLHAGAAFFQLVSELASTPLSRRLKRLRDIAKEKTLKDDKYDELFEQAKDLLGNVEVQTILLFKPFIIFLRLNIIVAIFLIALLILITLRQEIAICWSGAIAIIALSTLPVGISVFWFYILWYYGIKDIRGSAALLQKKIVG